VDVLMHIKKTHLFLIVYILLAHMVDICELFTFMPGGPLNPIGPYNSRNIIMSSEMVSNLAVMKNMYYLSPVSH
jgi:hypothetical protein